MSMLLAPTMMLFHSTFVLRALFGRSVGWDAQPRGDRGVSWREGTAAAQVASAARAGLGRGHSGAGTAASSGGCCPVIAGMLIAVPFTVLTSRANLGRCAARTRPAADTEESSPPPELAALQPRVSRCDPVVANEPLPPGTSRERAPLTMIEPRPPPTLHRDCFGACETRYGYAAARLDDQSLP